MGNSNKYMLFVGLGSVRKVENCDQGLENAFSSSRAQFFTSSLVKFSKVTVFPAVWNFVQSLYLYYKNSISRS